MIKHYCKFEENVLIKNKRKIETKSKSEAICRKEIEAIIGLLKLKNSGMEFKEYKLKKSSLQTQVLESVYKITSFPNKKMKEDLELVLKMPSKAIQIWFQNARSADKRQNKGILFTPENVSIVDGLLDIYKRFKKIN
ncbi:HD8 [Hepatospora eriocheir]|uniref:HD8 n=1 Tax=Hepatospora eriocheir TaxID=1081669 RepID=A0A1X0Q918_9MICR|nr:HD8 [Hepatospora eriocheir]